MDIFRALRPFFRQPRRVFAELTEQELERDIHSLITGNTDDKTVMENEVPKITGYSKEVVNEVRKGRTAIKVIN